MFHCLYFFLTFNESEGKFRISFCCFSVIKNIAVLLSSSNFSTKLIWEIIRSSDYEKLSSNPQLIKGKLQDLQKVLKYLNGTTKSLSHVSLSAGVSRII